MFCHGSDHVRATRRWPEVLQPGPVSWDAVRHVHVPPSPHTKADRYHTFIPMSPTARGTARFWVFLCPGFDEQHSAMNQYTKTQYVYLTLVACIPLAD